ncbi:hypothetical protein BHM03_00057487 [Ensete ventricosum]|nr:hypothetical protein BHM03_00057487 [Ensete ventricosum]
MRWWMGIHCEAAYRNLSGRGQSLCARWTCSGKGLKVTMPIGLMVLHLGGWRWQQKVTCPCHLVLLLIVFCRAALSNLQAKAKKTVTGTRADSDLARSGNNDGRSVSEAATTNAITGGDLLLVHCGLCLRAAGREVDAAKGMETGGKRRSVEADGVGLPIATEMLISVERLFTALFSLQSPFIEVLVDDDELFPTRWVISANAMQLLVSFQRTKGGQTT